MARLIVSAFVAVILLAGLSSVSTFVEGRAESAVMESTCVELSQKIDMLFRYLVEGLSEVTTEGLDGPIYVNRRRFTRPIG
ncbi:hypothetical protein ACTXT7_004419 [Hymenolepis weldensis]